ncbi:MAG: excinuclease ABC subunit UvrC [Candidatus Gracilibacteria bacterium]|nr:excinuclease ABC subunit UvrC [Candidatus Gracilibacteria bacterium]
MSNIKTILNQIPKSPGIYKFMDKNDNIIYVGKSVNLKSRVNSYFNGKSKLNFAKQKMVNLICNIDTIVTNNETESLILETTLIKKHLPKYNILMKDGKNHIYIKITDEEYPQVIKTRFKSANYKKSNNIKKEVYFGPYTSTYYVTNILKILKTVFGYGVGEHNFFKSKNSYTLDKYIFRNDYKLSDYHKILENIKDFLNGNTSKIKQSLEEKMREKAKNLQFEEAQKIKEKLASICILEETQIVREGVTGNYNVINFVEKFDKFHIGMIEIIDGKITGYYNYDIENKLDEDNNEIIKNFIENYIIAPLVISEEKVSIPTILLPINIDIEKDELLQKIKIESPQIGVKKELLDLCYKNIYEYAYKSHMESLSTKGFTKKTMQNLLEILGYKQINKDIIFECNDISHISGNHTVASRSILENGKSNTSKYKKLKIKSLSAGKIDDFNSMREVMTRRLKELEKYNNLPDLIIIDGGKGQLSSVVEIISTSHLTTLLREDGDKMIQVVGIAKREEELFLPGESNPILLKKDSLELRMIQKIRDEAHRFAITFNRDNRIKAMKKNILEELPGFGPKTRKKLLNKYGNVEKLREVGRDELSKILNITQIETLENHGLIE